MLKSEAWKFLLLNRQYFDCKVILDTQIYLTSKCFIPRYVCSIDFSTIKDLEVIIFSSSFSREEIRDLCGGYIYDESNQNFHESESETVESDIAENIEENESFAVLKEKDVVNGHTNHTLDDKLTEDTIVVYETNHDRSTNHVCHICGKIFDKSKSLRQHRFNVHKEAEYKCKVCSSVFQRKTNLSIHIKTHLKPSFQCHKCFKEKS